MYLHIGQETTIKTQDIIAVFDLDTSTVSKATRDYLSKMEKEKRVTLLLIQLGIYRIIDLVQDQIIFV